MRSRFYRKTELWHEQREPRNPGLGNGEWRRWPWWRYRYDGDGGDGDDRGDRIDGNGDTSGAKIAVVVTEVGAADGGGGVWAAVVFMTGMTVVRESMQR